MRAVDLFCGAGGSSTGAIAAGFKVVTALNHWPLAVETHRMNHPGTQHYCQDATLFDPRQLPRYDVLLASPECRGHTHARGKEKPHHDASRATAWCVVNIAEVTRPRFMVVENVPEMREWSLYPQWRAALEALGYRFDEYVLDSADFGVPQNRIRMYLVGARNKKLPSLCVPNRRHTPVSTILELNAGRWSPIEGHCRNTVERCRRASRDFGHTYVFPYYTSGSGETGRSVDRPLGTVTTKDRWAIVRGGKMRMLSVTEYRRVMGFPDDYVLTGNREDQIKQLGNGVCPPVETALCRLLQNAA